MGMPTSYTFGEISKTLKSVLTGEIWEISKLGDLGDVTPNVISVDGLPKPEVELIEVTMRNKKLFFPKYGATNGQLTLTLLEDADSKVRKTLYDKWETQIKDGVTGKVAKLDDIQIKVYKHGGSVARTYTLKGCVIASFEEELTLPEEGAEAVKITLTINYSDYEINFG